MAEGTQIRGSQFQDVDIDYYVVLGISRNSTPSMQALTRAFREKAKVLHPDHGGTQYEFDILVRAYQTLANPELRSAYDRRMSRDHYDMRKEYEKALKKEEQNDIERIKRKKKTDNFDNDKFQKRFERRRKRAIHKNKEWVADEDMYGTISVVSERTDDILDKKATDKREPIPDIPHIMPQYDRNSFHRYFSAQKDKMMGGMGGMNDDNDNQQGYCTSLVPSRVTENRMIVGSCQGRNLWSHYASADDIGLFGYVKPLSRNLMAEYGQMGDVTYEHGHMSEDQKRMMQERYNTMRNDMHMTPSHPLHAISSYSSGLQF